MVPVVSDSESLERGAVRIGADSMNSVNLVGRLARDVEQRATKSGTPVGFFTLAVDEPRKDGNTDWIKCALYGQMVGTLCNYTSRGDQIAVSGRLHTYDKDGETEMQVVVDRFDFCARRKTWEELTDGETT